MGYQSRYLVQNFGTLCWTIFVPILVHCATSLFSCLCKGEITTKYKIRSHKWLLFDYWIAFFNETLLFLSVCTALNFGYWNWDNYGDVISSILSIIFAALIVCFLVFVAVFYRIKKYYAKIISRDQDFKARFGNILNDIKFRTIR